MTEFSSSLTKIVFKQDGRMRGTIQASHCARKFLNQNSMLLSSFVLLAGGIIILCPYPNSHSQVWILVKQNGFGLVFFYPISPFNIVYWQRWTSGNCDLALQQNEPVATRLEFLAQEVKCLQVQNKATMWTHSFSLLLAKFSSVHFFQKDSTFENF